MNAVATPLLAKLRRHRMIVPKTIEIFAYLAKFPAMTVAHKNENAVRDGPRAVNN